MVVTFRGTGKVWDPTQARYICDFGDNGVFTTSSVAVAARLDKMGYHREPETSPTVQAASEALSLTEKGPAVLLQVLKPTPGSKSTSADKKDGE